MHAHVLDSAVHGSLLQIVGSSAFVFSILFLPPNQPPPPAPYPRAKKKNLKNKPKPEHIIYSIIPSMACIKVLLHNYSKVKSNVRESSFRLILAKLSFAPQNPNMATQQFLRYRNKTEATKNEKMKKCWKMWMDRNDYCTFN